MFVPGVCLGVDFGLGIPPSGGRGWGVAEVPLVLTGGRDGLLDSGVPFRTAVAPLRALAAPSREKAGPYPETSPASDDEGGRCALVGCEGLCCA